MINKKTKEIYSNQGGIELFYSPNSKSDSIVTKILNKEYNIVMNTLKKIINRKVGKIRGGKTQLKALDIGCSGGRYCFSFAKLGINTTGIDIAKKATDFAAKKAKELNIKNLNFQVGEATNLKFKPNTFDIIICIEVLHHLSNKDLKKALAEIHRVLKPGGFLIIDLKNKLNPVINLTYKHHTNKTFKNTGHLMLTRTPHQYTRLLKNTGFKITKSKSIFSPIKLFAPIVMYTIKKK
tara:strand:- start:6292 stop:7002 length:711 start_codon:yes stop_codon:yes gene_type:complete